MRYYQQQVCQSFVYFLLYNISTTGFDKKSVDAHSQQFQLQLFPNFFLMLLFSLHSLSIHLTLIFFGKMRCITTG